MDSIKSFQHLWVIALSLSEQEIPKEIKIIILIAKDLQVSLVPVGTKCSDLPLSLSPQPSHVPGLVSEESH